MLQPLALACLAIALPGLLLRRFGRWPVRLGAAVALSVLFLGVLELPGEVVVRDPVRVAVVPTAPGSPGGLAALRARVGPGVELIEAKGPGRLAERVAQAAAGDVSGVAVLWNGSFEARQPQLESGVAAVALTTVPAPPIEPDDCHVLALGAAAVGRPAALEVSVRGSVKGLSGSLVVLGPDHHQLVHEDLDAAALGRGQPVRVAFTPAQEGRHELELRLQVAGTVVEGRGAFEVAPAPRVALVGQHASELAGALEVQGFRTRVVEALPEQLDELAALVVLDPLTPDQQRRVVRWVDGGGGLLLVGAPRGGGVPGPDEPLHELLPVVCAPRAPDPNAAPGPEDGGRGKANGDGDATSPPGPDAKPPKPQPPKPQPPKPQPPKKAATGDTSSAELQAGPEVEVEKRSVAMVLLVDRSQSMGQVSLREGVTKMQYAKTAANETAKALTEGDKLGVVTFGANGQMVLPLTPATERERIRKTLEGLRALSETTLAAHALQLAIGMLPPEVAAVRHIVIISDGEIWDSRDFPFNALIKAREAREAGITVSVIQIAGPDTEHRYAKELATQGGGRFHWTAEPSSVPRLVVAEVVSTLKKVGRSHDDRGDPSQTPDGPRSDGGDRKPPKPPEPKPPESKPPEPKPPESKPPEPKPPESKPPEPKPPESKPPVELPVVAVAHSPLLEPDPDAGFPPVGGVLDVTARDDARVLLVARRGKWGIPLLAFCNRGVGKVGVWTSALRGAWGASWRDDPKLPARLAQWAASLLPAVATPAPRDLLSERVLRPPAPVRAERRALAALTGAEPVGIEAFEPPPPRQHVERRSRAPGLALAGALVLALLVLVEFAALRLRRARLAAAS